MAALALSVMARYPSAALAAEESCRLTWEKDSGPRRVGWQLADLSIQTRELDEDARASGVLALPAVTACLVALNNGALPVVLVAPALEAGAALSPRSWLPATTIRGVAVDDTGAPVRAEVHLQTANEDPDGPTCGDVLDRMGVTVAQALPNGEFLVGPVAAGRYRMTATAQDHSDFVTELSIVGGDTTATVDRGEIALPRVAQLLISCSLDSVEEAPPFQVTVDRESPDYVDLNDRWVRQAEMEIGETLEASVGDLRPGFYRVTLVKDGSDLSCIRLIELSAGPNELRFDPEPIRAFGVVTRGDDPVEGAQVQFGFEESIASATANEEGEYAIRLWAQADYGVFVRAPTGGVVMSHLDLRLTELGDEVEANFEIPALQVKGTVVSTKDGQPIPDARVVLEQSLTDDEGAAPTGMTSVSTTTDQDGKFVFESAKAAYRSTLKVTAEGYLHHSEDIWIDDDGADELWIEMEETDQLSGTVMGPNGEPISGAEVGCCAVDLRGHLQMSAISDSRGRVSLDAQSGVALFSSARGYAVAWTAARDEFQIAHSARQPPTRVALVDPEGEPLPNAIVSFVAADGVALPFEFTFADMRRNGEPGQPNEDGVMDVTMLPPGLYEVIVLTNAGIVSAGALPIPSSGLVTLRVSMPGGTP